MARLKFNSAGVSYAKRLAVDARSTSSSVREGIGIIQRSIQSDIAAKNNIASRLVNLNINLSQVENDIQAIYKMVEGASIKYNNTETQVVKWGQAVIQGKKITSQSANWSVFAVGISNDKKKVTKLLKKRLSIKNILLAREKFIDNIKRGIVDEVEEVTPVPAPTLNPTIAPISTPIEKEETPVVDEAAISWERMHNTPLIKNSSAKGDPGFIEGGCVITSMANLYRRKMALENINVDINRNTIITANNGNVAMYWDNTSHNMLNNYGYRIYYETGKTNTTRINQILQVNPEGVMVYAQGTYSPHAIVITGCDNGRYLVVDPIDGVIKYWEDCYSVRSSSGVYYGWSMEQFLGNAYRLGYIPE